MRFGQVCLYYKINLDGHLKKSKLILLPLPTFHQLDNFVKNDKQ